MYVNHTTDWRKQTAPEIQNGPTFKPHKLKYLSLNIKSNSSDDG